MRKKIDLYSTVWNYCLLDAFFFLVHLSSDFTCVDKNKSCCTSGLRKLLPNYFWLNRQLGCAKG